MPSSSIMFSKYAQRDTVVLKCCVPFDSPIEIQFLCASQVKKLGNENVAMKKNIIFWVVYSAHYPTVEERDHQSSLEPTLREDEK